MPSIEVKPSPQGVPGAVNDPTRIGGEELTFPGAEGTAVEGYLARPADAASHPGMIVIHEAGGLNEHIRDVCNRLANIGYVTLGVDLYTREGGPPDTSDVPALMARLFAMSDATVLGDLEGAADHLRSLDGVTGRVGCIGFCMGGRYTLLLACASDKLNAAVDCWGGFIDRAEPEERSTEPRPTPPLEMVAEKLECPLLAAVGAEDHNPSPELGAELRERALRSPAGKDGQEIKVDLYDGAGHAFFADYRPTYRPEPAAKLWAEVIPFLARHLQSG
ncbi:MAG: dienelactone hydrolase family protein [Solirubrobacterales bacterium]